MSRTKQIFSQFFFGFLLIPAAAHAQAIDEAKSIKAVAGEHVKTAYNLINLIVEIIVKYSFQVLGGIVVLVLGWIAAKYIANIVSGLLRRYSIDVTVAKFIIGAVKIVVMAFARRVVKLQDGRVVDNGSGNNS